MTDQPKPETITRPLPEAGAGLSNNNQETEDAQQKRLQTCFDELKQLLETHKCQLVPGFDQPIPVGTDGGTIQISARWSLTALPPGPAK